MAIKKNDFIELEYVGKEKESGAVFDTTDLKTAKNQGIYNPKMSYGSVIICVGQNHILPALDEQIEGKDLGEYSFELSPEQGFGQKDPKLFQLISTMKFRKEGMDPKPGMQIKVDDTPGIIKFVTGGRTLVDFNHPLSGKELIYELNVKRLIDNDKEKLSALINNSLGIKEIDTKIEGNKAEITTKYDIPAEVQEELKNMVKELIPSVSDLAFIKKESKKE